MVVFSASPPVTARAKVAVNLFAEFDAAAEGTPKIITTPLPHLEESLPNPSFQTKTKSEPATTPLAKEANVPTLVKAKNGFFGRVFTHIKHGSAKIGKTALNCFDNTLSILGSIADRPDVLATIFRKTDAYIFPPFELLTKTTKLFPAKAGMKAARDSIDILQLDVNYFVSGDWKESAKFDLAGQVALFASGVTGTLCWLGDIGALNLAKAGSAIGNIKVFKFAPFVLSKVPLVKNMTKLQNVASKIGNIKVFYYIGKMSLGFVTDRILGIAYVCFAAHAVKNLIGPGNSAQKIKAAIDLADSVSSIVLDILALACVTNIVALAVLGTVSLGFSLASFIYEQKNKKQLDEPRVKVS